MVDQVERGKRLRLLRQMMDSYYSPQEVEAKWHESFKKKKKKIGFKLGALANLGEGLCLQGTIQLLENDRSGWEPYLAGCQVLATRESIELQLISNDPNHLLGPAQPEGVRYLACLLTLGQVKPATYMLEKVLPITWKHRLRMPKEDVWFSFADAHKCHSPENFGPPSVPMYTYDDDGGLDTMLLSLAATALGIDLDLPPAPDFAPYTEYAPLIESPEDCRAVADCLLWMCHDRRIEPEIERIRQVCMGRPLYDVPIEIMFVQRVREIMNLPQVRIKDPLLEAPFDRLPTVESRYCDPLFDEVCEWLYNHYPDDANGLFGHR
ncbi:MAG: hypothetical protein ABJZ55_03045 [Fuerstiella sp.]